MWYDPIKWTSVGIVIGFAAAFCLFYAIGVGWIPV